MEEKPTTPELDALPGPMGEVAPNNPKVEVEVADRRQKSLVVYAVDGQVITVDILPDVIRVSCDCPAGMTRFLLAVDQFDAIAAVRATMRR